MNIDIIYKKIKDDDLILASYIVVLFWFILQLYIISMNWGADQYSDAGHYQRLAFDCFNSGCWYPMTSQINNDKIIFNPGYVNFLILQLKLFGSLKPLPFVNLVLNIILLSTVYKLISFFLSEKGGRLAIILFCILPSNSFVVSLSVTELFVATLIYLSLLLIRKSYACLLVSASLLLCAEYTRPSAVLFIPSIVLYFYFFKRIGTRYVVFFFISIITLYLCLSFVIVSNTDAKRMSGVTGGINLIMGANDDMSGRYEPTVFSKGKIGCVGDDINVYQRDSILTKRAIEWIKSNPEKYISFIPLKLFYLWFQDVCWSSFYIDYKDHNNINILSSTIPKSKMTVVIIRNISYYAILILSIWGMWRSRRLMFGSCGIILLPLLLNSMMIAVIVGAPRYHYIVIPILIFFAVIGMLGINDRSVLQYNKRMQNVASQSVNLIS